MNKNKKAIIAAAGVLSLPAIVGGYLFFTASGQNLFAQGKTIAAASWKSMWGDDPAEIIDDEPPVLDEISDSSTPLLDDSSEDGQKTFIMPPLPPPSKNIPAKNDNDGGNGPPQANGVPDDPPIAAVAPVPVSTPACKFPDNAASSSQKIILNEIAWMGSLPANGGTASDAAKNEWIELKNISSGEISLSGWQVVDNSGKLRILFSGGDTIAPGGFAVLVRGASSSPESVGSFPVSEFYSGTLGNNGDVIAVIDPSCNGSDILRAATGWPAGNNTTKQTLERNADFSGWHTSMDPGGTPGAENSVPILYFPVSAAIEGDGHGSVASVPSGISCSGASCSGSFASGTSISLNAMPDAASVFDSWSGACAGSGPCSLLVNGPASILAIFRAIPPPEPIISDPVLPGPASSTPVVAQPPFSSVAGHLLIAAVQIAGASTTNDLIKIYNPGTSSVSVGGWRLRKRSSTGTDSSIKVFPDDASVAPFGYFMWANSNGGFSEAVGANVSSTESIAADNSIALVDASGTIIDAVAWGTGTNQYGEGNPFATDPEAHQVLARTISGGVMADTDNNAADFVLQ